MPGPRSSPAGVPRDASGGWKTSSRATCRRSWSFHSRAGRSTWPVPMLWSSASDTRAPRSRRLRWRRHPPRRGRSPDRCIGGWARTTRRRRSGATRCSTRSTTTGGTTLRSTASAPCSTTSASSTTVMCRWSPRIPTKPCGAPRNGWPTWSTPGLCPSCSAATTPRRRLPSARCFGRAPDPSGSSCSTPTWTWPRAGRSGPRTNGPRCWSPARSTPGTL